MEIICNLSIVNKIINKYNYLSDDIIQFIKKIFKYI